jgi:hypothetical protein
MTASNIQKFDEITGQVFGALYQSFPVAKYLPIKDFVEDGLSFDDFLGCEVANKNGQFFFACVEWLAESGYLRFKEKYDHAGFADVVLTAKGLEALKAFPASLSADSSLGEQLVDATKSGAKSVIGSLAGEVLSVGSRILSNHLGLPL